MTDLLQERRTALNSTTVQGGITDILLNHSHLWEALREKASA